MNKLFTLILFLALSSILEAQVSDTIINGADTTVITTMEDEDFEININSGKNKSKWRTGLFDIGVSTFVFEDGFNVPSQYDYLDQKLIKSTNVNIALFRHRLTGKKGVIGFEYGISYNSNKYFFENNFRLKEGSPTFFQAIDINGETYKKNRLMANYLTLPLSVSLNTNLEKNSKSFNFSAGGFVGFLLNSNYKIKGRDVDKIKIKDDFSLTKFIAGLEGRIGIGDVNFYAQYFLTEMFQENEGPVINQFNFGITILPY